MIDNAIIYCNGLPFAKRSNNHLRQSLVNELYLRYLKQPTVEAVILEQLNDDLFSVDNFSRRRAYTYDWSYSWLT